MKIRHARKEERGLFKHLWQLFMEGEEEAGGIVKANPRNLDIYCQIFDAYVSGQLRGIVLFHATHGVLMWGERPGKDLDLTIDLAQAWGTYVKPAKRSVGVAKALTQRAKNNIKPFGFQAVISTINNENFKALMLASGKDFKNTQQIHLLEL